MLGMAARSSMATPIGPLRKFGETSVINIAIPRATGIAIISDRRVVTTVPNRDVAAPKSSRTGSQSVEKMNLINPNFSMASEDSTNNIKKIPIIKITTETEAIAVIVKKTISRGLLLKSIRI
jgi:hypothetical protein